MTLPATPPAGATPPSSVADSGAKALSQLSSNFDTFLSLLTTQLKNQDPLSPLDSNQFTQQLVQMSGVEAQLTSNNLLQQVANNTSNGVSTAVSLIGKNVRAVSDQATLAKGQAQWSYNLPADATDVKLTILNAAGQVVHAESPSDMKAGDHTLTWNGKDLAGTPSPDGSYTLKVSATDASGAAIATTTFVQGLVSSVEQSNGQTLITVGATPVPWTQVTNVTAAAGA